eukprot:scaffold11863_cov28-Attheya_sp.AAC.2
MPEEEEEDEERQSLLESLRLIHTDSATNQILFDRVLAMFEKLKKEKLDHLPHNIMVPDIKSLESAIELCINIERQTLITSSPGAVTQRYQDSLNDKHEKELNFLLEQFLDECDAFYAEKRKYEEACRKRRNQDFIPLFGV